VAVMCASGQRAAVASSLVQRYGAQHVLHVVGGGVPKWGRLGCPLVTGAAPSRSPEFPRAARR
jgi:rhodanese-related sulfurtransferase